MMKKSHNASFLLLGDLTVTTAFPFKLHPNVLTGSLVDVDDQLEELRTWWRVILMRMMIVRMNMMIMTMRVMTMITSTNSLTECMCPVARTKSSGLSCWSMSHIPGQGLSSSLSLSSASSSSLFTFHIIPGMPPVPHAVQVAQFEALHLTEMDLRQWSERYYHYVDLIWFLWWRLRLMFKWQKTNIKEWVM